MVWYSHLSKNFLVCWNLHKGFCVAHEADVDDFLKSPCFFYDPTNVGNLISGSSAFSKPRLYIWKFLVHVLLKPSLKDLMRNYSKWAQLYSSLNVLWHCSSLGLEWKLSSYGWYSILSTWHGIPILLCGFFINTASRDPYRFYFRVLEDFLFVIWYSFFNLFNLGCLLLCLKSLLWITKCSQLLHVPLFNIQSWTCSSY